MGKDRYTIGVIEFGEVLILVLVDLGGKVVQSIP